MQVHSVHNSQQCWRIITPKSRIIFEKSCSNQLFWQMKTFPCLRCQLRTNHMIITWSQDHKIIGLGWTEHDMLLNRLLHTPVVRLWYVHVLDGWMDGWVDRWINISTIEGLTFRPWKKRGNWRPSGQFYFQTPRGSFRGFTAYPRPQTTIIIIIQLIT